MNSISAKCGHVARQIHKGEPLEGKVLEFALSLVDGWNDETIQGIADKLRAGELLDDYQQHLLVDVILERTKINAASSLDEIRA